MTRPSPAPDARAERLTVALGWGVGLLLPLLPLWFNPWVALPFEPAKVALLRWSAGLLLLTAMLGVALSAPFRHRARERLARCGWPVVVGVAYAGVLTLAGILSAMPGRSFWGASDGHGVVTLWAQVALFLLVVVLFPKNGDQQTLIRWLLPGSVPVSLYGLAQAVGWDPLLWQSDSLSPVLSTLGRSNFLGVYLALLLPFSVTQALGSRSSGVRRVGMWLLVGLHALCLLLTLARSAWLAGVTGLLVTLWLLPETVGLPRRIYRIGLLVGAVLTLGLVFWLGEVVGASTLFAQARPVGISQPPAEENAPAYEAVRGESLARRWTIWRATWPLIGERPILGYGPDMFVVVFNERYPPGSLYAGTDVLVDDPHNQLLEHLLAAGLVGTMAWLVFLGILVWRGAHRLARETGRGRLLTAGCLGCLAVWLVQAQFTPDVVVVSTLFWVVAGLVATSTDSG